MSKKVALITGSSRGLGKAIAKILASKNYNIIINYNKSKEEAEQLSKELKLKYQVDTLVIKADVSNENEVKNMVEKAINKFQKIDVLVNNAGIAIDTTLEDKTKENFQRIIEVNLIGTFLTTKYVSKYMQEQKYGKIINITSTNAIDTYYPYSMDYDASKAGVITLTHNFAVLLSPNINVNAIAAGWINTEMNNNLSEEFKEQENQKILLKRFANPEEIANVVAFLASDEASYINNEIIRVDGGSYNG